MNKNNTHLDDLFAEARREDPVITQKNAGDLLSQSEHMQSAPFIFSTKGIIMSTIGLSLAAATAFVVLSGTPKAHQTKPVSAVSPTPATNLVRSAEPEGTVPATIDAMVPRKFITVTRTDQQVLPTPVTPAAKVIPVAFDEPLIATPVKVTGIKPITITPEKIAKMGITKKDDGTVTFSQKNEKGRIFSMSFPKNTWGIVIGDNEKQITDAPKFAPLIVTDTKGNKRMAQFFGDVNGMKMRAIQMNMRSDYGYPNSDYSYPDSLGNIDQIINNALRIEGSMQIGGEDGDMDKLIVGRLDSNELKDIRDGIHSEVKLLITKNNQVDIASNHNNTNSNDVHVFVNTETRDIDTTSNGVKKRIVVMNKTIRIDSTLRAAGESVKKAEQEINEVIKKLHLEKLDSLDLKMKGLDAKMEVLTDMEPMMKEMELLSIKLEHLIPVLVRSSTSEHFDKAEGITYDDGLIFWYDPSKDFTDVVPEATAEVEKSTPPAEKHSVMNNIVMTTSIFPNPAREKTMIRFTLQEPRTVGFSIHDLLGKRVAESGSMTGSTSGDYVHEIDVRNLKAGVYLIVLTTDKGEQSIQRLVIDK